MNLLFLLVFTSLLSVVATSEYKKILLTDIQVLILHHGRMTEGRRSAPVPQISCIGGTAGCSAFVPQVIRCYNRGTDGITVQWECKTDMDHGFRFGQIRVTCEGYDSPQDPYVLKGSCGVMYTIDLTLKGIQRKMEHDYYPTRNRNWLLIIFGGIILLIALISIIAGICKACSKTERRQPRYTSDVERGPTIVTGPAPAPTSTYVVPPLQAPSPTGTNVGPPLQAPPPTGTYVGPPLQAPPPTTTYLGPTGDGKDEYLKGAATGAAGGGLMGYLFGSRNRGNQYRPMRKRGYGFFGSSGPRLDTDGCCNSGACCDTDGCCDSVCVDTDGCCDSVCVDTDGCCDSVCVDTDGCCDLGACCDAAGCCDSACDDCCSAIVSGFGDTLMR